MGRRGDTDPDKKPHADIYRRRGEAQQAGCSQLPEQGQHTCAGVPQADASIAADCARSLLRGDQGQETKFVDGPLQVTGTHTDHCAAQTSALLLLGSGGQG